MTRQFHEFFNLIFGGFLPFGPTMYVGERTMRIIFEHNVHLPIIHFLGFAFGGVVNGRKYLLTIDFRLSTVNKYLSMLKQCLHFGQLC